MRQRNLPSFLFGGVMSFLCCMFPALSAELICIKDLSGSSPTCSGIRDLRGSRLSAPHGERQSVSIVRSPLSVVDAEQILFAWEAASELSSAAHEEVKESEPPRHPKFELGLHETHFLKHIFASRWQHAKMCQVLLKYEYWMIVWMCVFFELCFSAFFYLNDISQKLAMY